jgi:uncharacterized membrane protein YcaP (DUF421 family)
MDVLFKIDWRSMFVPTESILEIIIRGTIMYLAMYFLLRIFRRQSGSVGIADLLVIVVIADAAQNGMAGASKSITEAVILITTIILWDFFFDWLDFKFTLFDRLLSPSPLLLVKDGKMVKRNLEKEMITEDELMSQLRQQGKDSLKGVRKVYLESNGHFSILLDSPGKGKQTKASADSTKSN